MPDLVECIKRAAMEAVENSKPLAIAFGRVVSQSPLQINVDQKFTLGPDNLILARGVTDYTVPVQLDWNTENTTSYSIHSHAISGEKQIKVMSALKVDERVILLRMAGGQKFLVLDRVVT